MLDKIDIVGDSENCLLDKSLSDSMSDTNTQNDWTHVVHVQKKIALTDHAVAAHATALGGGL